MYKYMGMWYLKAVIQFRWSKIKLIEKLAHLKMILVWEENVCYNEEKMVWHY